MTPIVIVINQYSWLIYLQTGVIYNIFVALSYSSKIASYKKKTDRHNNCVITENSMIVIKFIWSMHFCNNIGGNVFDFYFLINIVNL